MSKKPLFSVVSAALLLTGCVGGGGSSSISSVASSSFSSWSSSAGPSKTVTVEGMSTEASYTAPAPDYKVTSVTDLGTSDTASATLTYNAGGDLSAVKITTPSGTLSWNSSSDTFYYDTGVVGMESADSTRYGIAIEPIAVGWDYQTMGVWLTGYGVGSGRIGAISIGSRTAGDAIPTSGTATFTGLSLGTYSNAAGDAFQVVATTELDADFTSRSLSFTTSDAATVNLMTAAESLDPSLHLSGTLLYAAGINSFTGSVTTAGGMSGSASGVFYGPAAEEVGGTFSVTGSGVEAYNGAFGAVR